MAQFNTFFLLFQPSLERTVKYTGQAPASVYHALNVTFSMDIVSSLKTDMFRMRINLGSRQNLEAVYAKNGLTLTDAVNVFFSNH